MSVQFLGYAVSTESADVVAARVLQQERTVVVNTINPHSYVVAKTDLEFQQSLRSSDVLLPDGVGIVLGIRVCTDRSLVRVSGMDFFQSMMRVLNAAKGKVMFFGSTEAVLEMVKSKSARDFPDVRVDTFSPPFQDNFSSTDVEHFRQRLARSEADVVFFGLTAPKQEKLIRKIGGIQPVRVMAGVGAVFDYYAGTIKRPSEFWIRLHLEWLIRLLGEPRRLWRRNFVSTPQFLLDCGKSLWHRNKNEPQGTANK